MQKYHDTVQDSAGNGISTASIYVYLAGTGTLATLKEDDETTALSNPITSADTDNYDSKGNFGFKSVNGIYDIKVVASDTTWRTERVLFDFSDNTTFGGDVTADNLFYYQGELITDFNNYTTGMGVYKDLVAGATNAPTPSSVGQVFVLEGSNGNNLSQLMLDQTWEQLRFRTREASVWTAWKTVINNVDDATFGGNVSLVDNKALNIGTGNDIKIQHTGTYSVIDNYTGSLSIRNEVNSGTINLTGFNSVGVRKTCIVTGGAIPKVSLYYDGVDYFHTVAGGHENGTFSATGANKGRKSNGTTSPHRMDSSTSVTALANHYVFYNPNGQVGSISTSASATAFTTTSDKRLKTSHGLLNNASTLVNQIEIHEYHFNSDESLVLHGVMAQDCNEVYPNAISYNKEDDTWGADYSKLVPIMLANIQELNKQIEELKCQ